MSIKSLVLTCTILIILMGGFIGYSWWAKQQRSAVSVQVQSSPVPVVPETPIVNTPAISTPKIATTSLSASTTPAVPKNDVDAIKAFILDWETQLHKAKTMNDIIAIDLKVGSQAFVTKFNAQKAQLATQSPAFISGMTQMYLSSLPDLSTFTFVSVNVNKNNATATFTSGKTSGIITLVKENGIWKISDDSEK